MRLRINLGELIHELAVKFKDRPAITMAVSGETLSYREFDTLINRIGHGLKPLTKGSTYVGIMHENDLNYLATTYALKKLNKIEVSINRAFRGVSLSRMITLTACDVLITSETHFNALDQIKSDLPHIKTLIVTSGAQAAKALFPNWEIMRFEDIISERTDHIASPARDTDVAAIMFTSGTTGVSKGCELSHRYAVRTAENMIGPFRLTKDDVNYTPYPLSHIGPAYYDILPSLMVGGRTVIRDGFSLSNFWNEVTRHGVTWFMCLGSVQQLLYSAPPSKFDLAHKITRAWATPAPVSQKKFKARFGVHILPGGGYGSTDAGWVVVPQWDHPGGILLPHFDLAIVDEHDDPLPTGVKGEIVIRPKEPGVMADGYFGMPERTVNSRKNLWFHTGDIGWLDEKGLFYFTCRIAERIRVKGEMVSGFEVEEGALMHQDILDAAAIGIPGELGEEDIRLFVTLRAQTNLTETQIKKHCQSVMAKFMVPKIVTILDEMPRTPTGKPQKGKLAQMPV